MNIPNKCLCSWIHPENAEKYHKNLQNWSEKLLNKKYCPYILRRCIVFPETSPRIEEFDPPAGKVERFEVGGGRHCVLCGRWIDTGDYYQCGHETLESELQNVILHFQFPTTLNSTKNFQTFNPKFFKVSMTKSKSFNILEFEFFMMEANVM